MPETNRKRRRRLLLALLLLLCLFYGGYRAFSHDPALDDVHTLRQELANPELTAEQRREKFRELRAAMEKLTDEQRSEERKAMAAAGRKRFEAEMKRYAQMSRTEKTRYLDEQIDRQEQRRRQAQANQAAGRSGTGPQGNSPRPTQSPEERERRRKQMLDDTTPEFRASMDQYTKDMQARRQQRGLPPTSGRGGR
jgi:hypothetical protein